MITLCIILSASFLFGLILTPLARVIASRCNFVDQPDGRRKIHVRPIPLSGGIAVLLSAILVLGAVSLVSHWLGQFLVQQSSTLIGLLVAAMVIALVGLADDYRGLRGRHKLLGQFVAVGIVLCSGVLVRSIRVFDWEIELGYLSIPFTAFWLLGAINSLNLIDGMDGLLASLGVIICLAMAIMAVVTGTWSTAAIAAAFAGSLLAFLFYNFPPASIFLGDCGSMLVGLVVGVLAIKSSLKAPATVALAAPAALFTIPIFDTAAAIIRRKLTGRSIYTTDRGHIHHCLLGKGLSNKRVLMLVSCLSLLTVCGAISSLALNNEIMAIISASVVICILITTRLFGYAESLLMKQRLVGLCIALGFRSPHRTAHEIEVRLQGSADWKEIWSNLTECAERLNLRTVRLDLNAPAIHEGYHARWDRFDGDPDSHNCWRADIPLIVHGHHVGRLEIMGNRDQDPVWGKIAEIAQLAEEIERAVSTLTTASRDSMSIEVSAVATATSSVPAWIES